MVYVRYIFKENYYHEIQLEKKNINIYWAFSTIPFRSQKTFFESLEIFKTSMPIGNG